MYFYQFLIDIGYKYQQTPLANNARKIMKIYTELPFLDKHFVYKDWSQLKLERYLSNIFLPLKPTLNFPIHVLFMLTLVEIKKLSQKDAECKR